MCLQVAFVPNTHYVFTVGESWHATRESCSSMLLRLTCTRVGDWSAARFLAAIPPRTLAHPDTTPTHFSGKDKVVKYWDADKFEQLLALEGHHGEVWCLAVSSLGDFLITGGRTRRCRWLAFCA